jgi:ornithine cyclodeaminase
MVFSAETGAPLALLQDEGLITDVRTALAGVVATSLARPDGFGTVGIVGTGIQARLQLELLHILKGPVQARVWGRTSPAVEQYLDDIRAKGIAIESSNSVRELCGECDTIITTTPSTKALVEDSWVRAGTHITAIGADAEGKQELETALFARARGILVDSREQCIDHAEAHYAVRAGIVQPEELVEIGAALDGVKWQNNVAGDITIADLSGLGATDAMMAQLILHGAGATS